MNPTTSPKLTILHVEDNPRDARLLQETINGAGCDIEVCLASNGQGAFETLLDRDVHGGVPDLILLDCHLPDISGEEVLHRLKNHPELRRIPVVVFSDDDTERTIRTMYDAHANAYVMKPDTLDGYQQMVDSLEQFWGGVSELSPVETKG